MQNLRSQHFLLLLAIIAFQLSYTVTAWLSATPPKRGKIETGQEMFYVGENLPLMCVTFSNFTGEVRFVQGNVNYNQEYVRKINETHALLNKAVSDDDFRETFAQCVDGGGVVASKKIYTDYPPQNATDLQMVWLDEKNLLINWGFNGTPYKNGHTDMLIKVTGEWSYNASDSSSWQSCYSGKLNNAACNVTGITDEFPTVYVRVTIANVKRSDTVSTVFPGVRIREHAKPLPVGSVEAKAVSSRRATVDVTSNYNKLVYNITYYTTVGGKEIHNTMMTRKTFEKSFEIDGLHPYYSYTFEVRAKFDTNRGYLSDPVKSTKIQMEQDAPAVAPEVTPGSYFVDRSQCSSAADRTHAYIYFQELAEEDKNGEIVNYTATTVINGEHKTFTQNKPVHTLKVDNVTCYGSFNVTLHANTVVGSSPPGVLRVSGWNEAHEDMVDKVKLKIKSSSGIITAEWEPALAPPDVSYLLYFCEKDSTDNNMCQNSIQHVNFSTAGGVQLPQSAHPDMKFGLVAISKDSSSNGIQFTDCIYDPSKGVNETMNET